MDWEGSLEHDLKIKTKLFQYTVPTKTKTTLFFSYVESIKNGNILHSNTNRCV